jgi:hypothetical protein
MRHGDRPDLRIEAVLAHLDGKQDGLDTYAWW